ncbi:MAG: hypothetical protein L6R38_007923, partial [Xanthoria sp. 2 TBL-2021]
MLSFLRLLNLLLCVLISITPVVVRQIPHAKTPIVTLTEEGQDPRLADADANKNKPQAESADPITDLEVVHVLDESTTVYCDPRSMTGLKANFEPCQAAFVKASSHSNGREFASKFWGKETHYWAGMSHPKLFSRPPHGSQRIRPNQLIDLNPAPCGIFTPTFDDVSNSNVTWTGVINALNGIFTKCTVDGKVLGEAAINHEN